MIERLVDRIRSQNHLPDLCSINKLARSPVDGSRLCLEINIVIEHRFAFPCWCRFNRKTYEDERYRALRKPTLVTIDWHDDVGLRNDYKIDDLNLLDPDDTLSAGLFSWGVLRSMNDGNVYPALHHDLFSDVYVLLKQDNGYDTINSNKPNETFKDKHGKSHDVFIFNDSDALIDRFKHDFFSRSVLEDRFYYLDIDMDYFTKDANIEIPTVLPEDEISVFCDISNPVFGLIKDNVVGVTIALEPDYCSGLENSVRIYSLFKKGFLSYYDRP